MPGDLTSDGQAECNCCIRQSRRVATDHAIDGAYMKGVKAKAWQRQTMVDLLKEICPRGNNKVVILYFLIHDKCLLFMLELY